MEDANNYVVKITNAVVDNKYVFYSEDFPSLLVKNKFYESAYIDLSVALEPLLLEKYGDQSSRVKIAWDYVEGTHTLQ